MTEELKTTLMGDDAVDWRALQQMREMGLGAAKVREQYALEAFRIFLHINEDYTQSRHRRSPSELAKDCYKYANAMIRERMFHAPDLTEKE